MIPGTNIFNSPIRRITAKVELYNGSTLADTFSKDDRLNEIVIERGANNNKFFGFGLAQKQIVKLNDKDRELALTENQILKTYFDNTTAFPPFYIKEVKRDENSNNLTITAYDALEEAKHHTVSEVEYTDTLGEYIVGCALLIGAIGVSADANWFRALEYPGGPNFEGTETIREAFDALAEATQSIYFINSKNMLVFKRLDQDGLAEYTIPKAQYFTLKSNTDKTLAAIHSITTLGDNVGAELDIEGETQYIRDNPFWELRDDIGILIDTALAAVGGLTIGQFNCSWRGNYLLEPGDKIEIVNKDGSILTSYLLNDKLTYRGGLQQQTSWEYKEQATVPSNPSTLGEALKQTFARVDKQNQQIELLVNKTDTNSQSISNLQMTTGQINASVVNIEKANEEAINGINADIVELTRQVNATMTAEDVVIEIERQISNGVDKVETSTGFTFNEEGLTVSKSNSDISTTITENGMTVQKSGDDVLIADKEGVKAIDLHATTFLIIGENSRFEDMGNRTACFWIGGNS